MPCPERPTSLTRLWCCSFAAYSPDKDSDIRVSARVLDLLGSGIGKGAVGVTYRRDLDTVQVRDGSFFSAKVKMFWKDFRVKRKETDTVLCQRVSLFFMVSGWSSSPITCEGVPHQPTISHGWHLAAASEGFMFSPWQQ